MIRIKNIIFSILLILVVSLFIFSDVVEAAKKKRKAKTKSSHSVDKVRCGVCLAVVDEVLYELRKTENSTSTLDLRWGLTAEVTEGRAKRIGKVIPYKRSQLRSIEIMEKICENMKDYGKYEGVSDEVQLLRTFKRQDDSQEDFERKNQKLKVSTDRDDQKKFERFCEELVDESEAVITETIRDELNISEMEDVICFGRDSAPCGLQRSVCKPGSVGPRNGTMPCNLCFEGKYQPDSQQIECLSCGEHENTTQRGSNSSTLCLKECKPGTYSATGLEPCYDCGLGMYQPSWASRSCESCQNGLGTNSVGSVFATECVSVCGDYRKSSAEECDDGNKYPGDGCSDQCVIEASYRCDAVNGQRSSCNKVVCGDNKIETSNDRAILEQCDDNNTDDGDGCSSSCSIEAGWACTPGKCSKVICGDGNRQDSADGMVKEACDDGNDASNDGCSSTCQIEENSICDGPADGKHSCHTLKCGDGFVDSIETKVERCDDFNLINGDGCSDSCEIENGWECEEGSARWGAIGPVGVTVSSRNSGSCKRKEICGDGFRVRSEQCDDGNTASEDGCSSTCTIEDGFTCSALDGQTDSPPSPGQPLPDKCDRKQSQESSPKSDESEKAKGGGGFFGSLFGSSEPKKDL